ncbi:hypothetical protein [Arsenophonus nasoniae]|uniref:Uncharacterized protein n=1 Tax=Arsenophonus nasoniae TaxID=638 RepID=A0AA95GGM9_9GAMM|nr:hypothetical protein [Arsenophonus nasoniae]WGL95978.1 hypothetical protein QE207_05170 [Arsenophonus nasoniae]
MRNKITKKIKFLEDEPLCGFRKDTEYKIKYEDEDYYLIERRAHNLCLLEKVDNPFDYEIIIERHEEQKTSALDYRIKIHSEYKYIEQQQTEKEIVTQGHPHAELMAIAAEIAKTKYSWETCFQCRYINHKGETDGWKQMEVGTPFESSMEYRLKPRTIKIGNREINAPECVPLQMGQHYVYLSLANVPRYWELVWGNTPKEQEILKDGLVFLTKEDAIAAAELIIELLRGDA